MLLLGEFVPELRYDMLKVSLQPIVSERSIELS